MKKQDRRQERRSSICTKYPILGIVYHVSTSLAVSLTAVPVPHILCRYALKILLKFLGYNSPNFKFNFERVKKVLSLISCGCYASNGCHECK